MQPTVGRWGCTPAEPYPPDGATDDSAKPKNRPAQNHPWRKPFRAVRLFKLRQAEKGECLAEAVAEPAHGGGEARGDLLDQVDDRVPQSRHHLGRRTLAYPALVFAQRHVAPVVRAVLYPPCSRTSPSRRRASASSLCRLVIPYTTSTVVSPFSVRSLVSSKPCASPAQSCCFVRMPVSRSVLTSSRPCPLSTLRASEPKGGGASW